LHLLLQNLTLSYFVTTQQRKSELFFAFTAPKFGTFGFFIYLCQREQIIHRSNMESTALNPTQLHLLKLFSFNNSENYAREIQMVLTRHFQAQLDAEADRLWDEGILNQERLDAIRKEDLHAK
jgi:hypothetical protein